jgi:hypothetical protein
MPQDAVRAARRGDAEHDEYRSEDRGDDEGDAARVLDDARDGGGDPAGRRVQHGAGGRLGQMNDQRESDADRDRHPLVR